MKISNLIPRLKYIFNFKSGRLMDKQGNQYWYFSNFKQHRDNDLPAFLGTDGTKEWWKYGKRHRENGLPAIDGAVGTKEWWVEDQRHRDNGLPAVERMDGTKEWWVNGKRHRDDGPAIERPDGTKEWYRDGVVWTEGHTKAPEIRAQKVEEAVQAATVAPEEVRLMQPIKFKKPNSAPSP